MVVSRTMSPPPPPAPLFIKMNFWMSRRYGVISSSVLITNHLHRKAKKKNAPLPPLPLTISLFKFPFPFSSFSLPFWRWGSREASLHWMKSCQVMIPIMDVAVYVPLYQPFSLIFNLVGVEHTMKTTSTLMFTSINHK